MHGYVGQKLMSLRTAGSIDVERDAKFLKHNILTPSWNHSADLCASTIFWVGLNLKTMCQIKQNMKGNRKK